MLIREATAADVPALVELLRDDTLGALRESTPDDPVYAEAFAAIAGDPNQTLAVAELDGEVVGTLQLTIIAGLGRKGARRALIEAVRVRSDLRSRGFGRQLVVWAVERARTAGCAMVQLTSDKSRVDAHRFYTGLGFSDSHVGFKLML
ncbi:GNAT family N-acetyltransferase [Hamadaea tsunoensis]|uniref:GNAT family N-acetyltransferase n=1 Tax=Hamadaea tsunoensis TaxID=53368 RepID=UPI00042321AD|nr:GNAT family N-acetyltransferase [Hamadaea tsunoensis]